MTVWGHHFVAALGHPLGWLGRTMLLGAAWLGLVAAATGLLGSQDKSSGFYMITFGVAVSAASLTTLAVVSRRRWAGTVATSLAAVVVTLAGTIYFVLRLAPSMVPDRIIY